MPNVPGGLGVVELVTGTGPVVQVVLWTLVAFSVGSWGAAVGVANNTKLNVFELLRAVNSQAKNGVLYNGNAQMQSLATNLFDELNTI